MTVFDWFRGGDDEMVDLVSDELTKVSLGLGKMERDATDLKAFYGYIREDMLDIRNDVDSATVMLRWIIALLVLALVVAGVGLGVALSVVWG